jgi:hypothetical protein
MNVATHPYAPTEAVDLLARDQDRSVAWTALPHPALSGSALTWVVEKEAADFAAGRRRYFSDRNYVVHHPNTPRALRERLLAEGACECNEGSCAPAGRQRFVRGEGPRWP